LINKIKKKTEFANLLELLQLPYYSGVILDLFVCIKYGEYVSNFLSDCYRLNLKSFLNFPIIHAFVKDDIIGLIANLGFDAVIVEPNEYLIRLVRKYELAPICYGYIHGENELNKALLKNLKKIDHDGIFTIEATKEVIEDLKKSFNKAVINYGKIKGDIEVEILRS